MISRAAFASLLCILGTTVHSLYDDCIPYQKNCPFIQLSLLTRTIAVNRHQLAQLYSLDDKYVPTSSALILRCYCMCSQWCWGLQMAGSEFMQAIVGVGAARVRDLFKRARSMKQPCIIFVDEIDTIGLARGARGEHQNEEQEQTLNQLLVEMDGFTQGTHALTLASTCHQSLLMNATWLQLTMHTALEHLVEHVTFWDNAISMKWYGAQWCTSCIGSPYIHYVVTAEH